MGVANMKCFAPGSRVRFTYTNWRGRTAERHCIIESIGLGRSSYHEETTQWFINGWDIDKRARRSYAVADIQISSFRDAVNG